MKHLKRNVTIAAVLLLVCAAVYLNWSYNNKWGTADPAMVKAEDAAMKAANEAYEAANTKSSLYAGISSDAKNIFQSSGIRRCQKY